MISHTNDKFRVLSHLFITCLSANWCFYENKVLIQCSSLIPLDWEWPKLHSECNRIKWPWWIERIWWEIELSRATGQEGHPHSACVCVTVCVWMWLRLGYQFIVYKIPTEEFRIWNEMWFMLHSGLKQDNKKIYFFLNVFKEMQLTNKISGFHPSQMTGNNNTTKILKNQKFYHHFFFTILLLFL